MRFSFSFFKLSNKKILQWEKGSTLDFVSNRLINFPLFCYSWAFLPFFSFPISLFLLYLFSISFTKQSREIKRKSLKTQINLIEFFSAFSNHELFSWFSWDENKALKLSGAFSRQAPKKREGNQRKPHGGEKTKLIRWKGRWGAKNKRRITFHFIKELRLESPWESFQHFREHFCLQTNCFVHVMFC